MDADRLPDRLLVRRSRPRANAFARRHGRSPRANRHHAGGRSFQDHHAGHDAKSQTRDRPKPAASRARLRVIVPLLLEGMNARLNEVIEQIAAVYARNFTADELREAVAFYRGPTGQKIVQKLPAITQESMAIGQRFGQSIASELRGRMIDELRKRGHNI